MLTKLLNWLTAILGRKPATKPGIRDQHGREIRIESVIGMDVDAYIDDMSYVDTGETVDYNDDATYEYIQATYPEVVAEMALENSISYAEYLADRMRDAE